MADPVLNDGSEVAALKERERFAQILVLFGRHGLKGLSARLGLGSGGDETLDSARPEAVVALLRDIGPVAVKFGQILAMRSDLLDPEWIEALTSLQDRVPPLPFQTMRPLIEDAIGGSIESCFSSFDEKAIAAGSIAQVHAATLLDGRDVIVKVRRPGIERIVDADLRILRRLARIAERTIPEVARLKPDELLRYFAESLDREMDLGAEARASNAIGAFLKDLGVRTARFDWELSGRRVNIQERLRGIPASDLETARRSQLDLSALASTYAQAVLRMILINGHFHADPHPGNVFFLEDGTLGLIDFGAVGTLLPKRREELVRLGLAIASQDTGGVVDILMLWAGEPSVDRTRLEEALADLIDRFSNVLLEQIDLGDIFQRVFALLREFHLTLPPDLALVLRTLLTAEGFVRRIDPYFNIASELAPIAKDLIRERIRPARLRGEAGKLLASLGRAVLSTPNLVRQIEKVARTGAITVSIAPADLERLRDKARGGAATPPVYPAALAVCAAIVSSSEPQLAALLALLSVALAIVGWLKQR
ncbi:MULTISPECIES: AarF/ABC1/UbiB kinase family protein [Massilia]|jgi:ubiquinone biosynthesis protein|uniref:ABC1 kinase family protein n=1 Tax=Massilia TaxID=149698 RepID=UPI0003F979E7|nr:MULTISPECIES: AarF/UbiB family protein [Massilia]MDN4038908.1 AarF/UbiB family protein [Massilia sp. YIM B02443]